MNNRFNGLCIMGLLCTQLMGCTVAKVAGKTVFKATELTGKTAVATTELAGKSVFYTGKGIYKTGEFAGNAAIETGKAVYFMGTVPVTITNNALDTTNKVLTMTTQVLDVSGKVVSVSRNIQAARLDLELQAVRQTGNLIGVLVDVVKSTQT